MDNSILESITIRVAENGFTVSTYMRPDDKKKGKSDGCCMSYEPPKDLVYESVDGVLNCIREKLTAGNKGKSLSERVKAKGKK